MRWSRTIGAFLAIAGGCLTVGCPTEEELGGTTFEIGGGSLPGESWHPDAAIAAGSTFTVTGTAIGDDGSVVDTRLSSSDGSVLIPVDPGTDGGTWATFEAGLPGLAAVELIDRERGTWLDALDLRVSEPATVDLELGADRRAPGAFAVALGSVMAARVELSAGDGESLNHFDAVAVDIDGATLTVDRGGDVVKLTPLEPGVAAVTINSASEEVASTYQVHTVYASSISRLDLAVQQQCGIAEATVVAELATVDGLPVLGHPVSWTVPQGTLGEMEADIVRVSLDAGERVPISAEAAGLRTTVEVVAVDCEPAACSVGTGGAPYLPGALLLLLAAPLVATRRRP